MTDNLKEYTPVIAITDKQIQKCFGVMKELRPHLVEDSFVGLVRDMEAQGFHLAYIESADAVIAVAGYRISVNLFMGKHLYVDDLITSESVRSKGFGEILIRWLKNLAVEENCTHLHLDSGTHRHQAHKFYFKQGFSIASYHFSQSVMDY